MNPRHRRLWVCAFLIIAAILLGSCQSRKDSDKAQALRRQNDSLRTAIDSLRADFQNRLRRSLDNIANMRTGLWRFDTLSTSSKLVFTAAYPNATAYEIADALNGAFRGDSVSQFKITAIREHTAFVKVLDSERMTQGLGTTGAMEYLAQVTFSLTSVPGIQSVDFDFEEGVHAAPGVYDRQRFAEMVQ